MQHILLNRRGLDVVACIQDLVAGGQMPTKARIVRELGYRGIYHPPNGTHLNGMRQWFEAAGLVAKGGWTIDENRLDQLLGVNSTTLESYGGLTQEQRDFAKAFARLNVEEAFSNAVAQYATGLFGTEFPEGGLPQSVLFALRDSGLIICEKTTAGRGAKPYIVRPTEKLRNDLIAPIFDAIEQSVGVQYRKLIRMKYADILAGLASPSTNENGLALEALAFHLARLLGLRLVQRRPHSGTKGRHDVSIVLDGARLEFSRWQIVCKTASSITVDDVATEVGMAVSVKPNAVLLLTTGRLTREARRFVVAAARATGLRFCTIEKNVLARLMASPNSPSMITSFLFV